MKVLIITNEPFPYGMAATNRIICYAKGLIKNGLDCEVLVSKRTEPYGIDPRNNKAQGLYEGIPYSYVGGKTQWQKNLVLKVFSLITDYLRTLYFCFKFTKKGDAILCYFSGIALHYFVLVAVKLSGAKVVGELCEYPYCFMNKAESIINRIKRWIMFHGIFTCFDGFIVISESLKEVAEHYKAGKAKILKVPILVDVEKQEKSTSAESDIPYIFHAGTLTEYKDGIISTFKAFALAIRQIDIPIKFYIAGEALPQQKEILDVICEYHLENRIVFLGKLTNKEVWPYWKGASLAILNKNDNVQNRNGFSTKLGEILLSETAVITTTVGEANHYLKDGESAYIVEPHQPKLIAEKIIQAINNPEERGRIAKKGKEIAEKEFDCIYQGNRLIYFFSSIVEMQ